MGTEIDDRRDALVNKLAEQYKASYERMSAREEALREANKSLWQRVYDATVGVIKKILAFKDMLLNVLAKAADVVLDIISDPIGFLGNLVSAVMRGLKSFMTNIGTHLQKGLMEWLFGALAGAGLQLPETFDLKGIISIVLQVLGITYTNFRKRAVAIVGEPVVAALEQAAEVFKIVASQGIGGLWEFIKEKLGDLKSMVMDAIFDFVKERVLIAGVTWIIGLLNPASAFFKACKAIYDIVKFFIERGSQILALVNAIVDSIAAIAKGSLDTAAKWVEDALAKTIPVAIGFLASLLGLGDISGTIRETIDKAQEPVNKAIDWVIGMAVKGVKAVGKFVGGALEKKDTAHEDEPEKAAKIDAGLIALHTAEEAEAENRELDRGDVKRIVKKIKDDHPVFKTLEAVPTPTGWIYEYSASATKTEKSPLYRHLEDAEIYLAVREVAILRFGQAVASSLVKRAGGDLTIGRNLGDPVDQMGGDISSRSQQEVGARGTTVPAHVNVDEPVIGQHQVSLKQGAGITGVNTVVSGIGKYKEIVAALKAQGFDGPGLYGAIIHDMNTGKGSILIKRVVALLFGSEPARSATATVTVPLIMLRLKDGYPLEQAFGEEGAERPFGGGLLAETAVGALPAKRRADEIHVEKRDFREGTKIAERTAEYVERIIELVVDVIKAHPEPVRSPDKLKAVIMSLIAKFDEAAGVKT
jgi:hypothetical protein